MTAPNVVIVDDLPEGVPLVAPFNHQYNRLDYYYPRLVDIGVPAPETSFYEMSINRGTPDFDEGNISKFLVENGWRQAFVRGMFASAKIDIIEGSHLTSQDRTDIRDTVSELFRQHIVLDRPLGMRIAVREMIDLNYCADMDCQNFHRTEVRYIIDGGEVQYRFPDEAEFARSHYDCDNTYSYVIEGLDGEPEYPDELAERVANEFSDLSWSVDFVRDAKSGEWYCTDMGLNGLYWNETTSEWVSISGQPEDKSPEQFVDQMEDIDRKT